jgi:hypothetical protein
MGVIRCIVQMGYRSGPGTEAQRHEITGTQGLSGTARRHGGTEARRHGDTEARRHGGTEARRKEREKINQKNKSKECLFWGERLWP